MSLPYIFAGTCIVFVIICLAAINNEKKERKRRLSKAAKHTAATIPQPKFVFDTQVSKNLKNALTAKNCDTLIADILTKAVQTEAFETSKINREYNVPYTRSGLITDQMEHLGLISPYQNGTRRWLVSTDNASKILDLINGAKPYPG